MVFYKCLRCGFNTTYKSNFSRHLNRKFVCKPILNEIDIYEIKKTYNILQVRQSSKYTTKIPQNTTKLPQNTTKLPQNTTKMVGKIKIQCQYCLKLYSRKDSLNRHQKKCNKIIELANQNELLIKKVEEMIVKMSTLENKINMTNSKINSDNTIQINNFGSENIEYISKETYKKLLLKPLLAIPNLIGKKHFNKNHPENHNIKITNINGKYAKIRKNDKWILTHKKDVLEQLVDNGYFDLEEFKDMNEDELGKLLVKKFKRMREIYNNNLEKLQKETEIIVFNGTKELVV